MREHGEADDGRVGSLRRVHQGGGGGWGVGRDGDADDVGTLFDGLGDVGGGGDVLDGEHRDPASPTGGDGAAERV